MKTLNRSCGQYLAKTVRGEVRQCWRNALTSAALPGWSRPGAVYVEGWLVIEPGIVIEHGWVETAEEIIDPTLWADETLTAGSYFAGVTYDRATIEDILRQSRRGLDLPIVWGLGNGAKAYRHGWGGLEHAGYRRARDAAYLSLGIPTTGEDFYNELARRVGADERKVTSDGTAPA
jgi:hypothetical protein